MKIEDWVSGQIPLNVVCVLKRGGFYDFNYVKILSQGVRRHLNHPHRFICLTDADLLHRDWFRAHRIQCRPLIQDWPAGWSKIELFRPGLLTGRILYLDLATMITGSLKLLAAYRGRLAMADAVRPGTLLSSVMMWKAGDLDSVYERFAADPAKAMESSDNSGAWIAAACRAMGIVPDRIGDIAPDLLSEIAQVPGGIPVRAKLPGVGLISFRGGPKPHELADLSEFIRDHWV